MPRGFQANTVVVDDEQFRRALEYYTRTTSKTLEAAVRGKMRDLCWQACRYTPVMQKGIRGLGRFDDARAVAVARLRRAGLPVSDENVKTMLGRLATPKRAYLKAGFAHAGRMIAQTDASTVRADAEADKKYPQVRAEIIERTGTAGLDIYARIQWAANEMPNDRDSKQYILERSLDEARGVVYADMMRYLRKKMSEHAREVSAR